jgi:hypothetical protein
MSPQRSFFMPSPVSSTSKSLQREASARPAWEKAEELKG